MSEDNNKSARRCYHYQYDNSKGNHNTRNGQHQSCFASHMSTNINSSIQTSILPNPNSVRTFRSILLIYTFNTSIYFYQMINMCANTNTNTTIVTTLSTEVPTLCRFSTSDGLGRGGFEWASCSRCFGTCKPDGICLESAEMSPECRNAGGGWEIGKFGNL